MNTKSITVLVLLGVIVAAITLPLQARITKWWNVQTWTPGSQTTFPLESPEVEARLQDPATNTWVPSEGPTVLPDDDPEGIPFLLPMNPDMRPIAAGSHNSCPWDLDGDLVVGLLDLTALNNEWGEVEGVGLRADFNGDQFVGLQDLTELLNRWGPCQ